MIRSMGLQHMKHAATHFNISLLSHRSAWWKTEREKEKKRGEGVREKESRQIQRNTLQHTATSTQHTATHCNINATHCNTLQHTATSTQHTATHCNINATHCNTLQHTEKKKEREEKESERKKVDKIVIRSMRLQRKTKSWSQREISKQNRVDKIIYFISLLFVYLTIK